MTRQSEEREPRDSRNAICATCKCMRLCYFHLRGDLYHCAQCTIAILAHTQAQLAKAEEALRKVCGHLDKYGCGGYGGEEKWGGQCMAAQQTINKYFAAPSKIDGEAATGRQSRQTNAPIGGRSGATEDSKSSEPVSITGAPATASPSSEVLSVEVIEEWSRRFMRGDASPTMLLASHEAIRRDNERLTRERDEARAKLIQRRENKWTYFMRREWGDAYDGNAGFPDRIAAQWDAVLIERDNALASAASLRQKVEELERELARLEGRAKELEAELTMSRILLPECTARAMASEERAEANARVGVKHFAAREAAEQRCAELESGLSDAATSLETIGNGHSPNKALTHCYDVTGFAGSRARAAREVLAGKQPKKRPPCHTESRHRDGTCTCTLKPKPPAESEKAHAGHDLETSLGLTVCHTCEVAVAVSAAPSPGPSDCQTCCNPNEECCGGDPGGNRCPAPGKACALCETCRGTGTAKGGGDGNG